MELKKLYNIAEKEHIDIINFKMKNKAIIGYYKGTCMIGLNYSKIQSYTEEKCLLAEELGHYYYSAYYPLNSDKEVLTIVVEDETFSFQIESPQLGIIHVNWGDGKQNEYKGEKDDDMYYIEKNILMHKRGNTLLQSRTSTI